MNALSRAALATALAVSVAVAVSVGTAVPAESAPRSAANVTAHSARAAATEARAALPEPTRDRSVPLLSTTFTVHATQRTSCNGTAKCVLFSGTAAPGESVVVRYALRPGAPRTGVIASGPATALVATADAHGRWSALADFRDAEVTTDARTGARSVAYRVIASDDLLAMHKTGQYLGRIPVR